MRGVAFAEVGAIRPRERKRPIVLLGVEYWSGLLSWLRETVLADGKISAR